MNPAAVTLLILAAAMVCFVTEWIRADIVALVVLVALGASRVLTPQETFSSFGRSAVVTIASIFVLAQGLHLTGASERVGDLLLGAAGRSERRLVAVVMAAGAFLSLFMNNIAAASVLLPAVSNAAHRKAVSPARLLMPLAFATILGGMATLFTTANIVVSGLLREQGLPGFGLLDFAPVALPAVVAGIVYMTFFGRRWLPARSTAERFALEGGEAALEEVYGLAERLFRARIPSGSFLDGRPLSDSTFRERFDVNVLALERGGRVISAPPPDLVLEAGDILSLDGDLDRFRARDEAPFLEILPVPAGHARRLASSDVVVAEAVLAPRSHLIGSTLRDARFREKYGLTALAIWRAGQPIAQGVATRALQFGDGLLLQGPRQRLEVLRTEPAIIVLSDDAAPLPAMRPARMWLAIAIMTGALALAATNLVPTAEALLGGSLIMIISGCLTADEAYESIEWKAVFLVAGMLPMGVALTKTGLAAAAADGLARAAGPWGPFALLAVLFCGTMLLTQVISGPVVAAMVAPIAVQSAERFGVDPRTLAMAVALAASMAFLTPLGHPVNVLVMGPGGYRFADYFKVGAPLTLLATVLLLLMLAWIHPL